MPQGNYPPFTHDRLLEMGLSDEEAKEFIHELIPQIEIQIPLIQEAVQALDFHKMERLTHSIKGSATNLGTGGISDLLVAFNTYLKTGTDIDIAKAYFNHLLRYNSELKAQYS
jgi:chemotaxis protein histidine kinase CheA